MIKYKNLIILICIFSNLITLGCVSQKNCIQKDNLCGLIVDENNRPVENFKVICHINPLTSYSAYTNKSGIFVLPNMEIGNYKLSGSKENFGRIEEDFLFNGSSSIFCGQVSSLNHLLMKIDFSIENKEFEKAIEILDEIEVQENQYNSVLVLMYKLFLYKKINNVDAYTDCIRLLKKIKNDKCRKFIERGDVGI